MIVVQALPDELLLGFRARLGIVNGVSTAASLDSKLIAEAVRTFDRDFTPATALIRLGAIASSSTTWDFLMHHSTVAVNASADNPLALEELAAPLSKYRVTQVMSPSTKELRLCSRCVEEDLHQLGFSYWRRGHHIPGRYVCEAHGCPLELVFPEGPLTSLPQDWVGQGASPDEFLIQNHHFNPYVRWYLNHMDRVVAGLAPADGRQYKNQIYSALKPWRRTGAGWATQLACLISDAFTCEWLHAAVSSACASIEGVATNIVRPILYDYMTASQRELAVAAGLAFARQN